VEDATFSFNFSEMVQASSSSFKYATCSRPYVCGEMLGKYNSGQPCSFMIAASDLQQRSNLLLPRIFIAKHKLATDNTWQEYQLESSWLPGIHHSCIGNVLDCYVVQTPECCIIISKES
jgi:hypothetical protein